MEWSILSWLFHLVSVVVEICQGFSSICVDSLTCATRCTTYCNYRMQGLACLGHLSPWAAVCVQAGDIPNHDALHVLLCSFQAVHVFLGRCILPMFMVILIWQFFVVVRTQAARMPWPYSWYLRHCQYLQQSGFSVRCHPEQDTSTVSSQILPEYCRLCAGP